MKSVLAAAIIFGTVLLSVESTNVTSCTTVEAHLPEVDFVDCIEPPCTVYINSTSEMTMKFNASRNLEHIAPRAIAILGPIEVVYPLDQTDACEGVTNTQCPLAEGQYVEYTYGMKILEEFPPIAVTLEFSLVDLDALEEAVECFRVDLQVANP